MSARPPRRLSLRSPSRADAAAPRFRATLAVGALLCVATTQSVSMASATVGPDPVKGTTSRTGDGAAGRAAIPAKSAETTRSTAGDPGASDRAPRFVGMGVAELQAQAARLQAEFVDSTLVYEAAERDADDAEATALDAEWQAKKTQAESAGARELLAAEITTLYQQGPGSSVLVQALAGGHDSVNDIYAESIAVENITSFQVMTIGRADRISERADIAAEVATALRLEAETARSKAETLLDDIQGRAAEVAAAASKALAASNKRAMFADEAQKARNGAALRAWNKYLSTLNAAHVVPPPANELLSTTKLPRGLSPLKGVLNRPVAGVAATRANGRQVTVLPQETIEAVSRAFADLGKPYVAGRAGPDTYDCSGLTSAMWGKVGFKLPKDPSSQYEKVHAVALDNVQIGDLVFFADDAGIQNVGINLGGDLMVTADAASSQVGVQKFPGEAFAAARVTLPEQPGRKTAPKTPEDAPTRCGGLEVPKSANGMLFPIQEGLYRFSARFGDAGGSWSSGYHTGLDFAAPVGVGVQAAKTGTVSVEKVGWAGKLVTVDHGDGLTTLYAHMSQVLVKTGDTVEAGQLVGAVGEEGNTTGPHLHFEVNINGASVDPMIFLAGEGAGSGASSWGGFSNGMIPPSALCSLLTAPAHSLRCDAAHAIDAMATAYQQANGAPLCIGGSFRSYAAQVTAYAKKPTLAAVPGTSNHGWALAVDLCGGIESFSTPQHQWMARNAPRFGWVHPAWAAQGGSRQEPWHWEFGNIS